MVKVDWQQTALTSLTIAAQSNAPQHQSPEAARAM
jgi:hypothetical protein